MLKSLIFLSAIIASGLCRNTASSYNALYSEQISDKVNNKNDESLINWMDISSVYQKYKNYTSNDISVFLKLKLLSSINALANSDIDLGNGIRFAKDETTRIDNDDDDTNEYNENAILRSLPRSLNEKEDILSSKIWKRISKVLRSHTMQVSNYLHDLERRIIKFHRYMVNRVIPRFILDTLNVFNSGMKMKIKF